jgi:hypothetical protein
MRLAETSQTGPILMTGDKADEASCTVVHQFAISGERRRSAMEA